jgi:hypothetical protein
MRRNHVRLSVLRLFVAAVSACLPQRATKYAPFTIDLFSSVPSLGISRSDLPSLCKVARNFPSFRNINATASTT